LSREAKAKTVRILAVESSCDESAAAVLDSAGGLLAHELFSQVELHRIYGGVVPELASRDHVHKLLPLVRSALAAAGTEPSSLDGVAYTAGPGLIGALLTGAALARSLAFAWGVPAIGVHHLEGHLLAPLLEDEPPPFPHVALLVSGGHTMLIEVQGIGQYQRLGESRDDAAGEAFDKTAKLLGLPYPGGPELARMADAAKGGAFNFPRPMLDRPGLEFSFSGLKTAVLHAVRGHAGSGGAAPNAGVSGQVESGHATSGQAERRGGVAKAGGLLDARARRRLREQLVGRHPLDARTVSVRNHSIKQACQAVIDLPVMGRQAEVTTEPARLLEGREQLVERRSRDERLATEFGVTVVT